MKILIWDDDKNPPDSNDHIIYWRGCDANSGSIGIKALDLVEQYQDLVKSQYLSWVYMLGHVSLGSKNLFEILGIEPDYSYWWMTLIDEKNNYGKSKSIEDAIKYLAFVSHFETASIRSIEIESNNVQLVKSIEKWCFSKKIQFKTKKCFKNYLQNILETIKPYRLLAILVLIKYLNERWKFRVTKIERTSDKSVDFNFYSYFANFSFDTKSKIEKNMYWGGLPDLLDENNKISSWLYIYSKSAEIPSVEKAIVRLQKIRSNNPSESIYVMLDSFLSFKIVIKALKSWLRVTYIGIRYKKILYKDFPGIPSIGLFFDEDWRNSLGGPNTIISLLEFYLIRSAIKSMPKAKKGLYLQENQPWEKSLIYNWRLINGGELIGVPHSVIRYWDLRYFSDPRKYEEKSNLLWPDFIAVNSGEAMSLLRASGVPDSRLTSVEALRYNYLLKFMENKRLDTANQKVRILILTDYLEKIALEQIQFLKGVEDLLSFDVEIVFKPHPLSFANKEPLGESGWAYGKSLEEELSSDYLIVFAGPSTAAALDAYELGHTVVVMRSTHNLDQSPLRNLQYVFFVSDPIELVCIIKKLIKTPQKGIFRKNYFNLNSKLPLWSRLLEI